LNELTIIDAQNAVLKIERCNNLDEMMQMIKELSALKSALDAVKQFRYKSVLYAKLHAAALVRVVQLGGINELKAPITKNTAKWLTNLSEAERERYIAMCEEGLTICQIYRREIQEVNVQKYFEEAVNRYRKRKIADLSDYGYADISDMKDTLQSQVDIRGCVLNDVIDGTRNTMRQFGAIGIGDYSGVYIMPNSPNIEKIQKALQVRLDSIIDDILNVRKISDISGVVVDASFIESNIVSKDYLEDLIEIIKKPPCGNRTATATIK